MADFDLARRLRMQKKKTRLARSEEKERFFGQLEEELHKLDLDGRVVTALVYDAHGHINRYGERIAPENLFLALNLTIGTQGTHLTGKICDREVYHAKEIFEGYFVPINNRLNEYAVLSNIPVDTSDAMVIAYHFPKYRLRVLLKSNS